MNKEYRNYLQSKEWAEVRIDLFELRGFKCEKCHKKFKSQHGLEIHHKHYRNIFNEEPEDLIIVCHKCHLEEHKPKVKNKKVFKALKDNPKLTKKQNKRRKLKNKKVRLEMKKSADFQKFANKYY